MKLPTFFFLACLSYFIAAQSAPYVDDSGLTFNGFKESSHGITYGFIFPQKNSSGDDFEFIGEIIAPATDKWVGLALGGQMANNLLLVAWPFGDRIVSSPRYATEYAQPVIYNGPRITTLNSTVNETHWSWIYRCENCTQWNGGSIFAGDDAPLAWVTGSTPVDDPGMANSTFNVHDDFGFWRQALVDSRNSTYSTLVPSSYDRTSSSVWAYRNLMFVNAGEEAAYAPALASHDGQLWCVWIDKSGTSWYTTGNNTAWTQTKIQLVNQTVSYGAALAELDEVLHVVIPDSKGNLYHSMYNDTTQQWGATVGIGVVTSHQAAIVAFNGTIILAYTDSANNLWWSNWNPVLGWSGSKSIGGRSWGCPGLFINSDQPHIVFAANNGGRSLLELVQSSDGSWSSVKAPPETSAYGASATQFEDMAYVGFQSHSGNGAVFVSEYDGTSGSWAAHGSVASVTSSDNPAFAILDGVITCVFNSHNSHRDLLWAQRTVASYPLNAWMAHLDGNQSIAAYTIPGTHDSSAITLVPYTETQTMSIPEQLNAGIRFLDLRAGLVNNLLIMFHGDVPIGPPLSVILQSIYNFLQANPSEAIIVSLKQDTDPSNSNVTFDGAAYSLIESNSNYWRTDTSIPLLGDIRGQIQLLRRYSTHGNATTSIGIAATSWPDNNANFTIATSSQSIVVEDFYSYPVSEVLATVVPNKTGILRQAMQSANAANSGSWFISFASAANIPWNGPESIAVGGWSFASSDFIDGVNQNLWNFIYTSIGKTTPTFYGTILMDFPEDPNDDLIAALVQMNG